MLRHRAPLLSALALLVVSTASRCEAQSPPTPPLYMPAPPMAYQWRYVGPTLMLFSYADSTYDRRAREWNTDSTNDYEKMLWIDLKMRFWKSRLPADMRLVFDTIGYPTGRILLKPVRHTEELWYYSQSLPPLRFRDGVLMNPGQFEVFRRR